MRQVKFTHKFVMQIPDTLADGVIFVSLEHSIAIHLCACGCRNEVVTPIAKNGWQLFFDGETISMQPSIGNWNFSCRSHYWIINNVASWIPDVRDKKKPITDQHKEKGNKQPEKINPPSLWSKIKGRLRY